MRALKRLKEQLKHWREACGCGFDPSLLSDVARQVTVFLFLISVFSSFYPRYRYSSRSSSMYRTTTSSRWPCLVLAWLVSTVEVLFLGFAFDYSNTKINMNHPPPPCACLHHPLRTHHPDQALNDLRRGGGTGAKIEHILPHLDGGISISVGSGVGGGHGGGGGSVTNSRAASPELHGGKHPPRLSHDTTASAAAAAAAAASQAAVTEPLPAAAASPPELGGSGGGGGGAVAGGAMMSIANPGLVASTTAAPMSASKMGGGVHSFRGRGGAFGMLLHKVQTTQSSGLTAPLSLPGAGAAAAGGAEPESGGGDETTAPGRG